VIANDPPVVPPRIVSKVAVYIPPQELVDAYLEEIARGYGLAWRAPVSLETSSKDEAKGDDVDGPDGGVGVKVRSYRATIPACYTEMGIVSSGSHW
jgi:vacuolar protein sorting-associated protein IST1